MYTAGDKNQARGEMLAYPSGNMVTSILAPLIYEVTPVHGGKCHDCSDSRSTVRPNTATN